MIILATLPVSESVSSDSIITRPLRATWPPYIEHRVVRFLRIAARSSSRLLCWPSCSGNAPGMYTQANWLRAHPLTFLGRGQRLAKRRLWKSVWPVPAFCGVVSGRMREHYVTHERRLFDNLVHVRLEGIEYCQLPPGLMMIQRASHVLLHTDYPKESSTL